MMQERSGSRTSRRSYSALAGVLLLLTVSFAVPTVSAHEGEDHSDAKATAPKAASSTVAVRTAERNVQTPAGQFRARLRQSPPDPRTYEEAQFVIDLSEQIEGGFGGSEPQPLEGATITARVTTSDGKTIADRVPAHAEGTGSYGVHYAFGDDGNYKIIFDVRTSDNRQLAVDFPVAVSSAPINWTFWFGLAALALVSVGAVFGYSYSWKSDGVTGRDIARKTLPVGACALAFLVLGTVALAYFEPPRERRVIAAPPQRSATAAETTSAIGDPALGGSGALITIAKESQLLFGIRTAPIEERRIVSGLTTAGAVRARPDARAVITPPVSGRVSLNSGITLGASVGRGQRIGSIEQVLGAPEQASLEAQRIQLRTAVLEQQARASEQQANAQQARTRLNQAQRELQRATNLLEVGAAPRRRVEEAQTAVRIAEQEVRAAEDQVRVATQQAQLARESVGRVDPVRTFPLVSPITGIITELRVTTGQQVEAGAELLSVINLTTIFLEARVFERDLAAVRGSGRAAYTAPALNDEVYRIGEGGEGRLVSTGQSVDPQTRTVPVIFEVRNPLGRLREGMFVEITLDTSGGARVLSVPKQSIITEQGRTFVYVFDGGERFERRLVVLGSEGQDFYEVRSGLQAGERVVVEGIYQLRSTQPGG
ncbi:MAG: efflux RND transporter periplasmic adaptor subunit [Pyrinomonadaceae bacterium]|nr:efflux RND transporter periplasmic adaptor subunit [Pyrinomonadaceae bacterium]